MCAPLTPNPGDATAKQYKLVSAKQYTTRRTGFIRLLSHQTFLLIILDSS